MSVRLINPEATILVQLQGQWEKLAAMIVFKLAREKGVTLTLADMQAFVDASERGEAVLFTHGHKDSIDFKIVTQEAARRLAAHDKATNSGRG